MVIRQIDREIARRALGSDPQISPAGRGKHHRQNQTSAADRVTAMLVVQPVDATQLATNPEMAEASDDEGSEGVTYICMPFI